MRLSLVTLGSTSLAAVLALSATASFVACQSEERAPRLTADAQVVETASLDTGGGSPRDASPDADTAEPLDAPDAPDAPDALDADAPEVLGEAGADGSSDGASDGSSSDSGLATAETGDASTCLPPLTTSATGACGSVVQSWTSEGATHHAVGTALSYCTRPPSSGDHWELWASFRTYDKPVPYGYLVHDLEHGAVVILYRCASGSCPTVQAQLQAVIDARPVDPTCTAPVQRRVILAPDPTLDVEVGASAWGWTYRATCVDATSLGKFIDDHYNKASEDVCADGVVPP